MTESFNRKLGRLAQNVSGTGSITTNASTASAWQTARTITLGGDLSGSVSLDGSSNVSLTATVSGDSIVLGTDTTGNYVATVTAGSGITVSGSGTETASVTVSIDNTVATLTGSQTLTNKTISGADNTLSNIGNASLTNSSITINGTSTSLGGTRTLVTDDIAEDASPTNLWYTDARTRAAISVTDAGGDGSLSYVSGTGVITYTGPSASEVRAHFSAGTGVTITTGQIAIGQAVATTDNVTFAGVTADNVRVGVTAAGEIDTSAGNLTLDSTGGTTVMDDDVNVTGNLQIDGNLTVSGTTVTINATNLAVEDNMIYLNSGSTVTHPDLGFAGNYNDGTYRHAGLFRDESDGRWKFFHQYTPEPDASAYIDITHASFALAPVQASSFIGSVTGNVTGNASTATAWQTARTLSLTGDVTGTSAAFDGSGNISISTTIAADSVALGTDTTGNYVASITNGSYITGGNGGSEGATLTLAVDATSANTASKVVARDGNGDFSGRYIFGVHFNQSSPNDENPAIAAFWTNNSSDNYNRKATPAHVISQLGLLTTSNYSSYALPLSGGTVSGNFIVQNGYAQVVSGSITAANASTRGLIFDGNYTNGQFRHRIRKYDDGNGIPLYIDYAHATADSYTAIARFGGGGTYRELDVYGTFSATTVLQGSNQVLHAGNYSSYALPLSGGTLTGQLIVGATGTATSPTLRINTSSSSTFVHVQENIAANLTAGQHSIIVTGQATSTKNSGYIGYYWAGSGSNSNFVTIGHWGNDDLFRVYGDGTVSVGTNTVLHAGNYSSYAVPLGGGTMTAQLVLGAGGLGMNRSQTNNGIWFNSGTDTNHILWNDYYGGPGARGAAGSGFDGIKWNAYQGIHIRGGSAGAYNLIVAQNSSGATNDHTVTLYASNTARLQTSTSGVTITGDINMTGVINTTAAGGSILMRHSVSEVDAWIFMENAPNWGLYWKNAPSGQHTFGGYTSVGAELFGMSAANSSGNGVLTSNYVGATSAYAQWMLSNYTGYVWSASTVFAAGEMRAPIFYDSNDTAFYCDPNGTSRIGGIQITPADTGTTGNGIFFYGVTGDNPASYNHAAIVERLWGTNDQSELLLFKGNDPDASTIHDRVRIAATGRIVFHSTTVYQTYPTYISDAGTGNIAGSGYIYGNDLVMTGNVTAYSDVRLKTNITDITDALEKVLKIRGVTYNRIDVLDTKKRYAGVIAQEVEQVLPEVVSEDEEGMKNVAYGNMIGLLIEAIKEQQQEIELLKKHIKNSQ